MAKDTKGRKGGNNKNNKTKKGQKMNKSKPNTVCSNKEIKSGQITYKIWNLDQVYQKR